MFAFLASIPRFRLTVIAVCLISFAGILSSLAAQYIMGMNPCVMCLQQRLALVGVFALSLLCLLLPLRRMPGRTLAACLLSLPAAYGLSVAVRQIRLQSLPPELQPSCGAPLEFLWANKPLFDLYGFLIKGTGMCGEVYELFGVALPVWSVLFFSAVLLLVWGMWYRCRR